MTKYNSENMINELDSFEKAYKHPVNVSVAKLEGLFDAESDISQGYAAIVKEGFLLLALIPPDEFSGEAEYHKLPILGMSTLKVKKSPEIDAFTLKVKGVEDGEKYKFKITVVGKSDKESFPEQYKNCNAFIEQLTKWSKEI